MRKFSIAILLATTTVACSSPNAPTSPAAAWAAAHVNEVCIATLTFPGQGIYGYGKLQPVESKVPEGWTVVAISYCNPAE